MSTIAINFKPKESNPLVKYNVSSTEVKQSVNKKVHFLAQRLQEEVMLGNPSQLETNINKLKKMHKKFVLILGATAIVSLQTNPLLAQAQQVSTEITPDTVMDWGQTIALIVVAIGIALAAPLLAAAGMYRMLRKRKEAEEWTTDIIKGLVQVLIAIPVVYSLFYLAQTLFKNLPALGSPF